MQQDHETLTKEQIIQTIPGTIPYGTLVYRSTTYDLLRLPQARAQLLGWRFYLLQNNEAFAVLIPAHKPPDNIYHIQRVNETGISWGELFVEDAPQQWRYVDNSVKPL